MKPREVVQDVLNQMNLMLSDDDAFKSQFDAHSEWLINHINSVRVSQGLSTVKTSKQTALGIHERAEKRGAK